MKQIEKHNRHFADVVENLAPPGIGTDREVGGFFSGLVVALFFSFGFFGRYSEARAGLFHIQNGKRILMEGAVMPQFSEILGNSLNSFFLYGGIMLFVVIWHYVYYYQGGSKSIYVMKRLPNRWEIHKRAWLLPLLAAVVVVIAAFAVLIVYFEIYMIATPEQCILPGQWQGIWR